MPSVQSQAPGIREGAGCGASFRELMLAVVDPLVVVASHSKLKPSMPPSPRTIALGAYAHTCVYVCFPVLSHQGLPLATVYVFLFVYGVS